MIQALTYLYNYYSIDCFNDPKTDNNILCKLYKVNPI
jgi:hypothetical protein